MSSATLQEPLVRTPHFRDEQGVISYCKPKDDEIAITWNLTDYLATSETVSSAAYEDSGVTTSSKSVSSPSILFTVTGCGQTKVTATLSSGRTHERVFRFYEPEGAPVSDYGG